MTKGAAFEGRFPIAKLSSDALARCQIERDQRKTRWFPALFNQKVERMRASPLGFLRGSAPLFYEILAAYPELHLGPADSGWISGDLHLENFGVYRPELPAADDQGSRAVFDLNDFDEAVEGPWRLDVLRLLTSVILGAREIGLDRTSIEQSSRDLLSAYRGRRRDGTIPNVAAKLIERAQNRKTRDLLEGRTTVIRGSRRFIHGPRYAPIPKRLAKDAEVAFHQYIGGLPASERPPPERLEVLDCALRISGTGSLGQLRVAVLVAGKGPPDGCWLFDMKAEGKPAAKPLVGKQRWKGAERVLIGMHACLENPPKLSGSSQLLGHSMLVRRLTPQEDKLPWSQIDRHSWNDAIRFLGNLASHAHRLGSKVDHEPWNEEQVETLISQGFQLAGIHESIYLALRNQTRKIPGMPSHPKPRILPVK